MKQEFYAIAASPDHLTYTFESVSANKAVTKRVEFVPVGDNLYNLAFGDLNEKGEIDDLIVTNTNDMYQVIATVVQAILGFLNTHPDCSVYFKGSTPARTRLYQIIIRRELSNWNECLGVFGILKGSILSFETERHFDSFIIKLKDSEL